MSMLPALVVLLNVLLLFGTTLLVGRARSRYEIKAPATTGHPGFERAYRVQMNTLEATVLLLPTLWLAASYFRGDWVGIAGLVWIAGRVWYAWAYTRDPGKRGPGFGLSMLAWAALLIMAIIGMVRTVVIA